MAETLNELIRRMGKTQATCGISQVGASMIHRGVHRARASTINRLADQLGCDRATVLAACDESWRRTNPDATAPAIGPGSTGTNEVSVHAADPASAGGA